MNPTAGEIRRDDQLLGDSPPMQRLREAIRKVAPVPATVLIQGESGTGKELVARALHRESPRSDRPFLVLNCSAIPDALFESEMFGHRRGAFTGAVAKQSGYVESTAGGTLFLDEISELSSAAQAKILRLLEQKTYQPLGGANERQADIRMLAATNQALEPGVDQGRFRADLYYRLNACRIDVPPLRERVEDIPLLAGCFAERAAREMGKHIHGVDESAVRELMRYDYPGNVRELRNMIECAVIHCEHSGVLQCDDFPASCRSRRWNGVAQGDHAAETPDWPMDTFEFEAVEIRLLRAALQRCNGNVSAAARLLKMDRSRLRRRLTALAIPIQPA